jgi:hypothetical protein
VLKISQRPIFFGNWIPQLFKAEIPFGGKEARGSDYGSTQRVFVWEARSFRDDSVGVVACDGAYGE